MESGHEMEDDRPASVLVVLPYPAAHWIAEYEWHARRSGASVRFVFWGESGPWQSVDDGQIEGSHLSTPSVTRALLDASEPDLVVLHGILTPRAVRVVRRWCSRKSVPYVLRTDGNVDRERSRPVRHALKRRLYARVIRGAAVLAVAGSDNRRFYESFVSARDVADREVLIPFRLDIDSMIGHVRSLADDEASRAAAPGPSVVVVSRASAEKGIDVLLDALDLLDEDVTMPKVTLAGGGPMLGAIEDRVRSSHLPVTVLGEVDRAGVAGLLADADVFVLPSRREAWGFAINEAAAAALPMIVPDVAGAATDLVGPDNGIVFESGNPASLARAIREMVEKTPADLERMGQRSLERLGAWYGQADMEHAFGRVIASALSRSRHSSRKPDTT